MKPLITITGPSCSGKTTLVRRLLATDQFCEVVSFTSRQPRTGEVSGVDYYFKTPEECQRLVDEKQAAEAVQFKGNWYGLTVAEIESKLSSDKTPVVIVEPVGLKQLQSLFHCYSIYVDSDPQTLYTRFLTRLLQTPNPNISYEASRVASIYQEWEKWPDLVKTDLVISEFDEDSEDDIVDMLVDLNGTWRNDQG